MTVKKLKDYLQDKGVKFDTLACSTAYTAQETAANAHIPGKLLAKTVIIKIDGKLAMVVEPANERVDLEALKERLGAKEVELASEFEFEERFPDCELGAMPPFGNLYGMDVFVSKDLTGGGEIAFTAGSHDELVRMGYKDFESLVRPMLF